jgi:hypothetical protein
LEDRPGSLPHHALTGWRPDHPSSYPWVGRASLGEGLAGRVVP